MRCSKAGVAAWILASVLLPAVTGASAAGLDNDVAGASNDVRFVTSPLGEEISRARRASSDRSEA